MAGVAQTGGMPTEPKLVLVTGATGYIGGRLVPELLEAGYRVRCLARARPASCATSPGPTSVEVVEGDAADPAVVRRGAATAWTSPTT